MFDQPHIFKYSTLTQYPQWSINLWFNIFYEEVILKQYLYKKNCEAIREENPQNILLWKRIIKFSGKEKAVEQITKFWNLGWMRL